MSHIVFSLASTDDDDALRATLHQNEMQGAVSVAFCREPSYFTAAAVQGARAQVIKGVDMHTDTLACVGARLTLPAYLNGQCKNIGYLADLRLNRQYRTGTGLRRAFDFLRQCHREAPLPVYTTMILKDNLPALNVLAAGRAGIPAYLPQGFVHTPMLLMGWQKPEIRLEGINIRTAAANDIPQLFAFLNREHARRQFAPHYTAADLYSPRLNGLHISDFLLALASGRIIGALAGWEQTAFRQIRVAAYNGIWHLAKPLYNAFCRFSPFAPLPSTGSHIRCGYAALWAVENDDIAVFRALLRTLYRARCGQGWHYLVCALHERDPLLSVLDGYAKIHAGGHLFTVQFDNTPYPLDERVPYIEAAGL